MLKQSFTKESLVKILTSSDVWRWGLVQNYGSIDAAVRYISEHWKNNGLKISELKSTTLKKNNIFNVTRPEDDFAIRLLDRFIRRIYKVRQSDRTKIVKQVSTLLHDSGDHHIIRLDIKNCFESIKLKALIDKFEDDLILAPECLKLLKAINHNLIKNYNTHGLPRGLSISPTLAELYLETLDKELASNPHIIYSARYVDDIILFIPSNSEEIVKVAINTILKKLGLTINTDLEKYYSNPTKNASFDYLGYSIQVSTQKNKENRVCISISNSKINKIKHRIVKSLINYKKTKNISLLKQRLEYLSMLKTVKKGPNGHLLAGIAYNYQLVTDNFESLKTIDGLFLNQIKEARFSIPILDRLRIEKISFFSNAKNKKIANFTKNKTSEIMEIWIND